MHFHSGSLMYFLSGVDTLRVFRENDWHEDPDREPAAVVVNVRQPEIEHQVRIRDFENWLDSAGKSPVEMALKSRLRTILDR